MLCHITRVGTSCKPKAKRRRTHNKKAKYSSDSDEDCDSDLNLVEEETKKREQDAFNKLLSEKLQDYMNDPDDSIGGVIKTRN